jgi:8-oxo-dGTP diphosphatase
VPPRPDHPPTPSERGPVPAGTAGRPVTAAASPSAPDDTVRAAGCVLWRRTEGDGIEIALVHRPKYDDWSHPKGKLKPDEQALHCAVREVREETGMNCVPEASLPTSRYAAAGRPKEVRYWAAQATGGTFVPNREVDQLLWLPPPVAKCHLTWPHDRPLVDALLASLPGRGAGAA